MPNHKVNFEVLANAADNWTESALHLPINAIVKHVQQNYGLVSDENVLIAQNLDQDFLDQL